MTVPMDRRDLTVWHDNGSWHFLQPSGLTTVCGLKAALYGIRKYDERVTLVDCTACEARVQKGYWYKLK